MILVFKPCLYQTLKLFAVVWKTMFSPEMGPGRGSFNFLLKKKQLSFTPQLNKQRFDVSGYADCAALSSAVVFTL